MADVVKALKLDVGFLCKEPETGIEEVKTQFKKLDKKLDKIFYQKEHPNIPKLSGISMITHRALDILGFTLVAVAMPASSPRAEVEF